MPQKKGPYAGNPEGARQYLANAAAAGLWKPQKPLGEYKDSQVTRKANAFKTQEQAGVAINNKAARGHADIIPQRPAPRVKGVTPAPAKPVKGTTPTPTPAPAPAAPKPRKDVTIIPAPKVPLEQRIKGPKGSSQINTTRFSTVVKELKQVNKNRGGDAKVYFSVWDNRKGEWRKLYVNKGAPSSANGIPVGDLLARMKEKIKSGQAKTDREALLQIWQDDIAGNVAGQDTPDDLSLPEVITTISVHVMA